MSNETKKQTNQEVVNPSSKPVVESSTAPVNPEQKEVVEEKPRKKPSVAPDTIVEETGINLIPTMSKEEIKQEDTKKKINTSALISLSILFSVSILVVGFNIISKIQLNSEKNKLNAQESRMGAYNQMIIDNNEILHRISLYKDIQDNRYSTKDVIDYLNRIAEKSGSAILAEFVFPGGTSFRFNGEALDLEDVAKFWYLLSNDSRFESIELKNVAKGGMEVRFEFSGILIKEKFVTSIK